jgi:Tfp pilus assembly protein PilO
MGDDGVVVRLARRVVFCGLVAVFAVRAGWSAALKYEAESRARGRAGR